MKLESLPGKQADANSPERTAPFLLVFLLVLVFVVLVHGYHPLADDGAVYVAGIKKLIDPGLYPADAAFALSPTRLSIFAHVIAALVGWTRLPLAVILLLCHIVSIALFLLGSRRLAQRMFADRASQWGAWLLAACCFTLPVAGTSLCIMDPYVTARSFSMPLSLFALAAILGERWIQAVLWLLLTALLHPLMAAYAAVTMLTVALAQRRRYYFLALLFGLGWLAAGAVFLFSRHPDLTLAYNRAVLSRSYFFLSSWQWYEYLGLVLPLLLLGLAACRNNAPAMAATVVGSCALLISLCFVHRSGSLLLARLQVLRAFQMVYMIGVLLAGGMLGELAQRYKRAIVAIYVAICCALLGGQLLAFPASNHVEWPGLSPANPWQQAFLWIRGHTPRNAIFALDNDYIESPREDAQGFRATAERSALADYYKDGGIASNFPEAATLWWQGSQATAHLNDASDQERLASLLPLGVSWIVLPAKAQTSFTCPWANASVRVCHISAK
jgi:hypothetical protein